MFVRITGWKDTTSATNPTISSGFTSSTTLEPTLWWISLLMVSLISWGFLLRKR